MTAGLGIPAIADAGLSVFLRVRPRLFGIAYRMLGSTAEAEDIVQDVWVRWQIADRSVVRDAAAFLTTTATRLAINLIQSARSRRETYVGRWLPEPADTSADPWLEVERGQALALGVQLLLEKLTPTERAAYILREAFDYPYRDIANVLRLQEANARQVVTRARQHVATGRRKPASSTHLCSVDAVTTHLRVRSMARRSGTIANRNTCGRVGGTAMKSTAAEATVRSLLSKDLADVPGKELSMITVEYPPGSTDPVHTHHAQALVYVLEGSIEMQVRGGAPVTLAPGQTFYEGPDDVHIVGRNASQTAPAKFLVVLVKDKGAPILTPVK